MVALLVGVLVCLAVGGEAWAADVGRGDYESDPTRLELHTTYFTLIVFGLLLLVLWKFAWGPIATALKQREDNIAGQIDRAEQLHKDAAARLAEYEEKLRGSRDEVRAIIEQARRDGEALKAAKVSEAASQIRDERDRSLRDIETAKNQALKELAEKTADMAIDLAGRVIGQQLQREDHARLIDEAVERMVNRGGVSTN